MHNEKGWRHAIFFYTRLPQTANLSPSQASQSNKAHPDGRAFLTWPMPF
ncbi:hypothetical protein [Aeromonas veronii]